MTSDAAAPNQPQIDYWNGRAGERWASEQETLDRSLERFGQAALAKARARAGEHVLDVGCGTGATTIDLAKAVGVSGSVLAVDVSAPMLARARERATSLANISFLEADAATSQFESTKDLIFSRFGVMFFADPALAFTNLRGALKESGRLAFVCWRKLAENPWMEVPLTAAASFAPPSEPEPPHAPGPLAFADPTRIATILAEAGFDDISITPFDSEFVVSENGIDGAVMAAMRIGPAARLVAEASDEVRPKIREAMHAALLPYLRSNVVALPAGTWIVEAKW